MDSTKDPTSCEGRVLKAKQIQSVSEPSVFASKSQVKTHPNDATTRRRDGNAEARVQAAIVEWVRTVAPDMICFHPANGGLRHKSEAARLKWIGVLAGIPDLVVVGRDGRLWFIEVKSERGSLSGEQRAMRDRLIAMRIPFVVARSIDDVRQAFALWEIQTREAGR